MKKTANIYGNTVGINSFIVCVCVKISRRCSCASHLEDLSLLDIVVYILAGWTCILLLSITSRFRPATQFQANTFDNILPISETDPRCSEPLICLVSRVKVHSHRSKAGAKRKISLCLSSFSNN